MRDIMNFFRKRSCASSKWRIAIHFSCPHVTWSGSDWAAGIVADVVILLAASKQAINSQINNKFL